MITEDKYGFYIPQQNSLENINESLEILEEGFLTNMAKNMAISNATRTKKLIKTGFKLIENSEKNVKILGGFCLLGSIFFETVGNKIPMKDVYDFTDDTIETIIRVLKTYRQSGYIDLKSLKQISDIFDKLVLRYSDKNNVLRQVIEIKQSLFNGGSIAPVLKLVKSIIIKRIV